MKRRVIGCLLGALLLFSTGIAASAADALYVSSWTSANGTYALKARSFIEYWQDSYSYAGAGVTSQDGVNVPANYMGAKAMVYEQGGGLVTSASWYYNPSSASWIESVKLIPMGYGWVISKGAARSFSGTTYKEYTLDQTAAIWSGRFSSDSTFVNGLLSPSIDSIPKVEATKTNIKGESYGSGLMAETLKEYPDLIKAVAKDGITGYVKKSDLFGECPDNPSEVNAIEESLIIPLYDSDGETIVGYFEQEDAEVHNASSIDSKSEPGWLLDN